MSEDNVYFNVDSDGSEDYIPAPKKSKATTTKAAGSSKPKALKKPVSAPKQTVPKKVLKEIHDNGSESDQLHNSDSEPGPSNRNRAFADDDESALPVPNKGKNAHEKYQVLDAIQHILRRPDSYVGSLETIKQHMWVYDRDSKRMVYREVQYAPAFLKIFDEILVNAADNKINDPSMDTIKVNIDIENNSISVYNNGSGIPIVIHEKEKVYIPQMIFGQLLSSSNYDDTEKKITGGRNGYGAKLTNIYSTEFTVETADKSSSQLYKQTWTENMSKCSKPKITKNGKNTEYTRVTFKPDLPRFSMDSINSDTEALLMKRVYDMAGSVKDVKVWLNDERLKIKGFKGYVEMYLNSAAEQAAESNGGAALTKPSVIYEQINPRWEIAFALSDGSFQQISFANSISTTKGGTHVNMIADQIAKNLIDSIGKKNKAAAVKPAQIKNHMWIFVNALIENPTFDSQTKDTLTLPASKFGGGKATISEEFMKKVSKSGIVDSVLNWAKFKADQQAKKTDGSKRTRLSGVTKLSDANNAGGRQSSKCTLILTEGDSAKALAVAGLAVVGRDNFGVFPLRGKLLNVREAKHEQIMKNEEIQNIKKIIGLQHNKQYTSTESLRYGSVMIMTDQDHDGSHIKGLLINFFDYFYPSLLKIPNFLVEFVTPIVRVSKRKNPRIATDFFTQHEFELWYQNQSKPEEWRIKYFKGLGTSNEADSRNYFSNMERHMISFQTTEDNDREAIELAFSKKHIEARKEWLRELEPDTFLNHDADEISISDFVNKELILFSMADNIRSIPSVADGFKPVQRKVLWGAFKRNLKEEVKVVQLCGAVSEMSRYHHGEDSLMQTVVNMAQDYVGSNNINLLQPNGQFGTRDMGGKDHAAARYIYTQLSLATRHIFHPADDPLLNYLVEEGNLIEPEWYMPIIPQVLVNGGEGIGTGWSTSIQNYNPEDIVANLKRMMNGEDLVPMTPWWRGFRGNIVKIGDHRWQATGIVRKINSTTVEITELPIHKWTMQFKGELEAMIGEKGDSGVKDYKEYHDNLNVHFVITMAEKELEKAESQGLEEYFKLHIKLHTSNMICFDFNGRIKKYDSPEHILEEFYPKRLAFYQKRKDYMANQLETECERLSNQARFVQMMITRELTVSNRKKADIVAELRSLGFKAVQKVEKAKRARQNEPIIEELDTKAAVEAEEMETGASSDYDYLLGMAIWSLTKEKVERLLNQKADKEHELLTLLAITPLQMWTTDLDAFLEEWQRTCRDWIEAKSAEGTGKRKQATLKTRKSLSKKKKDDSDNSNDEFRPTKASTKPKLKKEDGETFQTRKRVVSDKTVAKGTAGDSDARPTVKKKVVPKLEEDSEGEAILPPKNSQAAAKRKMDDASSAEENEEASTKPAKKRKPIATTLDTFLSKPALDIPSRQKSSKVKEMKPKSPPKPKATAHPKRPAVSDDESGIGDLSFDGPVVKRDAPRRTARAPAKYVEVSSDGDAGMEEDDDSFRMD